MSILDEILEHKRREVEAAKRALSPEAMAAEAAGVGSAVRGFRAALESSEGPAVIAELKRRSPSGGEIRPGFDPVACAQAYAAGGAAALSVLTDFEYFGGRLEYLALIRDAVSLPLLRKEFIVDAYQIDEARARGADAVLLIAAALAPEELCTLRKRAVERQLDVLVEVHDEAELETALSAGADLIGVNNRDLRTMETDLAVTERLAGRLVESLRADPPILLVAESGIRTAEDVRRLSGCGARAFLVGESLMRANDIEKALRKLRRVT